MRTDTLKAQLAQQPAPDDEFDDSGIDVEDAYELAVVLLDDLDDFLNDLINNVRLTHDMRERLVALSKDTKDWLLDYTQDEGDTTP